MKKVQLNKMGTAWLAISIDDYHPGNLHLANKFKELGLPAVFYLNVGSIEARQQVVELHNLGMEIGSHTISHYPDLKRLTWPALENEIVNSKQIIEDLIFIECQDFAYPRGRFNDSVVECVKQAGYKTARTTHVLHTDPGDPFRMETTIHAFNGRKEYKGKPWKVMADFYLDNVMKVGGTFHIWAHAADLIKQNETDNFFNFLESIKTNEDSFNQ